MKSSIGRASMPASRQLARGAAGRDDLDAELAQAARELDEPAACPTPTAAPGEPAPRPARRGSHAGGAVADQLALGWHCVEPIPRPRAGRRLRRGLAGSALQRPGANRRTARGQQRVLERAQRGEHLGRARARPAARPRPGGSPARCRRRRRRSGRSRRTPSRHRPAPARSRAGPGRRAAARDGR